MPISVNEIPIIDIHDHVFPEKVADRASSGIGEYYGMKNEGNGTFEELMKSFSGYNLKYVITSSAATKAKNVYHANDFMSQIGKLDKRVIPFGSFHAEFSDFENEVERFSILGLKGVKFHTDFQGFCIDDKRLFDLYEILSFKKIPVLFHVGDAKSDFSHPKRIVEISRNFPNLTIIAAHMGGYKVKELSEENLVGKNVYFDISEWYEYMSPKEVVEMVHRHGIQKVIYGSDYPLQSPRKSIEKTFSCPFNDEEKEMIFYKNAVEMFKNTSIPDIE